MPDKNIPLQPCGALASSVAADTATSIPTVWTVWHSSHCEIKCLFKCAVWDQNILIDMLTKTFFLWCDSPPRLSFYPLNSATVCFIRSVIVKNNWITGTGDLSCLLESSNVFNCNCYWKLSFFISKVIHRPFSRSSLCPAIHPAPLMMAVEKVKLHAGPWYHECHQLHLVGILSHPIHAVSGECCFFFFFKGDLHRIQAAFSMTL